MIASLRTTLATASGRHQLCRRIIAGSGLILIAATWRLWFSSGEFPQVPFFEFACWTPQWVDWTLSGLLIVALVVMLVTRIDTKPNIVSGIIMIAALVALIILNQHRLQPWAWFLILATIATSARADYALSAMCWLLFGVYFFSGLSKLDPHFLGGGGAWLLDGLLKPFGSSTTTLRPGGMEVLLWTMPVGEIVTAFCVLIPRFRFVGFFLVVAMHGTLVMALGPFGLDHKPGVLLWNGTFQLLALPLLWKPISVREKLERCVRSRFLKTAVLAAAVGLPCFGTRWAPIIDQWPSWSVYATWYQPMAVTISSAGYETPGFQPLQEHLAFSFVFKSGGGVVLASRYLELDRWSLAATGAPIFPQDRFQLGVFRALPQPGQSARMSISVGGLRTPQDGSRFIGKLSGHAIDDYANQFWFNTRPRPWTLNKTRPDQSTN